jgi:phospholipid transport system substrate-binding protein
MRVARLLSNVSFKFDLFLIKELFMKKLMTGFATLLLIFSTQILWAATVDEAQQLIKTTTDEMLVALKAQKDNLKSNPKQVYKLVDDIVLNHFDFEFMSKYVLGKRNWKKATPAQQTAFVAAFRDLLVRTYATSLVDAADKKVEVTYLPVSGAQDSQRITLKTVVKYGDKTIKVDYGMYAKGQWQIWDVIVEGVSLVMNYQSEFEKDVNDVGMDGLVDKIKSRNADALKAK